MSGFAGASFGNVQIDADFMEIELSFHCRNLKKLDTMSNTDPFCVAFLSEPPKNTPPPASGAQGGLLSFSNGMKPQKSMNAVEIGRTTVVYDTQNPDFATTFKVKYHFEENQMLTVKVFDEDKKGSSNLRDHDYIGCVTVSLGQLMGSEGNTASCQIRGSKNSQGYCAIRAEEVSSCADQINLQFQGKGLKNKDGWFGKSDPFYTISRCNEDNSYTLVFKSEVVMDDLSPNFKVARVQVQKLCNGDYMRPLKIEIWDWDADGEHDTMGYVETNLAAIIEGCGKPEGRMAVKYQKKTYGTFLVSKADVFQVPTLTQYLSGGMQCSLMVAVDYTGSNGNPMIPGTLHYMDPRGIPNMYQSAIGSVGHILQEYDSDKKFPIWGFGARIGGTVQHCFQMGPEPEVCGVPGLLDAYRNVFAQGITMSGPTLFSQVIGAATQHAIANAQQCNGQSYSVLLILTDGIINDMQQTVDALVAASGAPLSVVIVGIGPADFSGMEVLDGDGGLLKNSRFKSAERDIVQFVPFERYLNSPSRLAAETLAEIPHQCTQYLMSKGIHPMPPLPPPDYSAMAPPSDSGNSVMTTGGAGDDGSGDSVPQFFDFVVPPTAEEGSEMEATSPDGTVVKFIVPPGNGGTLSLQY